MQEVSAGLLIGSAIHAFLGLLAIIAAVWILAEVRREDPDYDLVYKLSVSLAILVWLSWITAGWYYVLHYGVDKAVIKAGPMPYAHAFGMEVKEHIFYTGLLLATALPLMVSSLKERIKIGEGKIVFHTVLAILLGGIVLDALAGLISLGAKAGWMAKAIAGG